MHQKYKKLMIIFFTVNIVLIGVSQSVENNVLEDEKIDQQQTKIDTFDPIYGDNIVAQSFRPTLPQLTKVSLYITKKGSISSDLNVYIKNARSNDTILTNHSLNSSLIPENTATWVTFNLDNIEINNNETYYILCSTLSGDGENNYIWYGTNANGYERGIKYISSDNGTTWQQETNADCAFKTYGGGPVLKLLYIVGSSNNQIEIGVKNSGTLEARNIKIASSFSGGIMIKRYFESELNNSLEPSQEYHMDIFPIIGFGSSTLTVEISSEETQKIRYNRKIFIFFPFYIYVLQTN